MRIREAGPDDGPALIAFFRRTAIASGTTFVFDRGPDFFALLAAQGESRTLLLDDHDRITGAVTVLWHDAHDGDRVVRVAEVRDLRVDTELRGSRAAWRLLSAVCDALRECRAEWVLSLIGDDNRDAIPMVSGRLGLLPLTPQTGYRSTHYPVWPVPKPRSAEWRVDRALPEEGPAVIALLESARRTSRLVPVGDLAWPDPTGRSHAWVARDSLGELQGALLAWDPAAVRRIVVMRYTAADLPLRMISWTAGLISAAVPMPPPGGVLRLWATRAFALRTPDPALARALVAAALRDVMRAGCHVLQVNLREDDPLVAMLPRWPRSVYRSTVFAGPLDATRHPEPAPAGAIHADVALV